MRNLRQVRLENLARVNVLFGDNGSGKTSVLESIHLLAMARSFRGSSVRTLISHGDDHCTVYGKTDDDGPGKGDSIGVQRNRAGEAQIRISGRTVRTVAELAEHLPLQVITSDSFALLTGPPGARRQYLDWGVFHVEHEFYNKWQTFQRCIKQRNKLLRRGKIDDQELGVWSRDLASAGTAIHQFREAYFHQLTPRFNDVMSRLAPSLEGLDLHYRRGWDKALAYAEALAQGVSSDIEQGFTHTGPQRADIRVTVDGHSAADTLSRGQQKLVVCGLKLAQGQLMSDLNRGDCTYLVDDLPSELDEEHSQTVCRVLADLNSQVFITCVDQSEIRAVWPENMEFRVFHVEHGDIHGP